MSSSALLLALAAVLLRAFSAVAHSTSAPASRLPIRRVPRLRPPPSSGNILTTDVSIANKNEFAYLVPISVGGQEFSVILDTGSSDFWVVSSECTTSDCTGIRKYAKDRSASFSTSGVSFELSYLTGSVTGNIALDTIKLGRFEIFFQVFALVNRTTGLGLSNTGNSGILGLAFPSIASISLSAGNTLLENILASLDEPNRFYAFKLGRGSGADDPTSSFTVGGLDPNITGDLASFSFTPVSKVGANSFNYWKLPLHSFIIDNTTFPLSPSLVPGAETQIAVLDTGTTLILGPTRDVEAFWKAVDQDGATRKNDMTGLWEIRCDRGVSVSLLLGATGNELAIPIDPSDINWDEGGSEDGWCMGGLQANDGVNSGDWLLGDIFLRNVYVTHHSANSTHPPLIGLLSTTDPSASMSQFRNDRGPEQPRSTARWTRQHLHDLSLPTVPVLVYVLSSVCGFLVGAIVTTLVRVRRHRSLFHR